MDELFSAFFGTPSLSDVNAHITNRFLINFVDYYYLSQMYSGYTIDSCPKKKYSMTSKS